MTMRQRAHGSVAGSSRPATTSCPCRRMNGRHPAQLPSKANINQPASQVPHHPHAIRTTHPLQQSHSRSTADTQTKHSGNVARAAAQREHGRRQPQHPPTQPLRATLLRWHSHDTATARQQPRSSSTAKPTSKGVRLNRSSELTSTLCVSSHSVTWYAPSLAARCSGVRLS